MPRLKNSLLRTYFEARSDKYCVCKNGKCNKTLNVHAGNLERHLKTVHQSVYYSYLQKKNHIALNKSDNDAVEMACSVKKNHIQMALIELFTKCGRPLSLAEDQAFKILLKPMLRGLKMELNEQSIVDSIVKFSLKLKQELSKELSERLLTLKIDAATRSSESILSVSVQYIKNNSIILKTLGIRQLTQQPTSEYLKKLLLDILTAYNINVDQVVTITIDNETDTIKDVNYDISNSIDGICAQHDILLMDLDLSIDGTTYVRCGAHILQMCVTDVLDSPDVKEKLDIIRTIIKQLRTQLHLMTVVSESSEMPLLDNSTRWTSTYQMLERFMQLKETIEMRFEVSETIWSFAAEFLSVFNVIYNTSNKLKSKNCLYSDIYIDITNITLQLGSLPKSELRLYLLDSLNRQKLMLFENDLFVTAVFLDPRIKVCLASDQVARAKNCITQLYARLLYLKEGDTKITKPSAATPESSTPPALSAGPTGSGHSEDALEEYFKAFDEVSNRNTFTNSQQIEQDVLAYSCQSRLGIKENIIDFWSKQNNTLTAIAHLVLGIPCTQLSVEWLFSALDYMQENKSSKYSSSADFEHLLLVKANAEFIYD